MDPFVNTKLIPIKCFNLQKVSSLVTPELLQAPSQTSEMSCCLMEEHAMGNGDVFMLCCARCECSSASSDV